VNDESHQSYSEQDTEAIGAELASRLEPGDLVLLHGDLGAGKTAFVRGLAAGLGIDPAVVTSPTFTLVHDYQGRIPLVHVDLYRLNAIDLDEIGLDEALGREGVVAVEWAERLNHVRGPAIEVRLIDRGDDHREIRIVDVRSQR
jgi:tRNA threonylcarbamoyladenosine biosynthesis protein TsaE